MTDIQPTDPTPKFTYADDKDSLGRRLLIRAIEQMTGQPKLRRLYLEYQASPMPGEDFWSAAIRKLELNVRVDRGAIELIPRSGPCVVVSNHPYGVIDGIIACKLVSQRRPDFRILTNSLLYRAPRAARMAVPDRFREHG